MGEFFKECSCCQTRWLTCKQFLVDKKINYVGYQGNPMAPEYGLFLFDHTSCGSTVSVAMASFAHYYNGPVISPRRSRRPRFCLYADQLESCPEHCECAYVHNIVDTIKNL